MKRWKNILSLLRYFKKASYNKNNGYEVLQHKINENGNTSGSISHIFDEFSRMTKQNLYL